MRSDQCARVARTGRADVMEIFWREVEHALLDLLKEGAGPNVLVKRKNAREPVFHELEARHNGTNRT